MPVPVRPGRSVCGRAGRAARVRDEGALLNLLVGQPVHFRRGVHFQHLGFCHQHNLAAKFAAPRIEVLWTAYRRKDGLACDRTMCAGRLCERKPISGA